MTVVRDLLALLLISSGALKLRSPRLVREMLVEIRVPQEFASASVFAIPTVEVAAGALAIFGTSRRLGIPMVTIYGLFIVVSVFAHWTSPQARCRCFGALSTTGFGLMTVLRNIVLAILALVVVTFGDQERPPMGAPSTMALSVLAITVLSLATIAAAHAADSVPGKGPR